MSDKGRCDCGKVVSLTSSGRVPMHHANGKKCQAVGRYPSSIIHSTRTTPYLHPEPRLVGESLSQQTPIKKKVLKRFRKTNFDTYTCSDCGDLKWIEANKLASILRTGPVTLKTIRCWGCREGTPQKGQDELHEAKINLARRKLEIGKGK